MAEDTPMPEQMPEVPDAGAAPMRPSQDPNLPTLMGLPATASKEDIIDFAVMALATLQNQYNALQAEHNAMVGEEVQNRMAEFADVIGNQTEFWQEKIILNRKPAIEFLRRMQNRLAAIAAEPEPEPRPTLPPMAEEPEPLRNRINPSAERPFADVERPTQETSRAAAIRNRAVAIRQNNPNMTFRASWELAEKEIQ